MNQQKIFNFKIKQNFDNDDFFVSKSNELAHKFLLNLSKPEKYIHLKGPLKSGKTHLGLLWKRIHNAIVFNYNNYDQIMSQKKNVFIDNFTYGIDEEKLFYLINHCYNNNLKILITSELSLLDYQFKLNDLLSRLKLFYFIEILNPDDELIINLLVKLLYDRLIKINNHEIFSFIFKRTNRTYLDIYNFVDNVDKLSLSQKRQITIPLIKELL